MLEVLSSLPERLARKIVQIDASAAIEELCIGQIQMSAQYRGKMIPLIPRDLPHCKGTGNVRRSLQIMSTGICQQKSVRLDLHIGLRCRRIMIHRCMLAIGNDRIKAVIHKMLLLFSQIVQVVCR